MDLVSPSSPRAEKGDPIAVLAEFKREGAKMVDVGALVPQHHPLAHERCLAGLWC
jgi:hypothetical protein